MKILVTGATGYIGGRLIELLAKNKNYTIHGLARHIPDSIKNQFDTVQFHAYDLVNDSSALRDLVYGLDCIIHLAAVNEVVCKKDPVLACQVNTVASLQLLEIAKEQRVKRFVYLSTAHVYGSPLLGDFSEGCACHPRHPYSITHKAVEDFVLTAQHNREIEGIVLRLSNGFGRPSWPSVDRWMLLLNQLARSAVEKRVVEIKSTGSYRDFITLEDTFNV
jgi:UDP-glucose 4-epimerase